MHSYIFAGKLWKRINRRCVEFRSPQREYTVFPALLLNKNIMDLPFWEFGDQSGDETIPESERLQIQQVLGLEAEELQVEEVDDEESSDDE